MPPRLSLFNRLKLGMNTLTAFDGSIFEVVDGKVNLTKICKHFGKSINDWTKTKQTQAFLQAFSNSKADTNIIVSVKGGNNEQGSWTQYREVALKLAQWISPEFEVFCIQKLDELFQTGKASLQTKKMTTLELLKANSELIIELEEELQETKKELEYKQSIIVGIADTVPPETLRIKLNDIVRKHSKDKEIWHQIVWGKLYERFMKVYHIDLKTRAKHSGKSKIAEAEKAGQLENLYKLALQMFEV